MRVLALPQWPAVGGIALLMFAAALVVGCSSGDSDAPAPVSDAPTGGATVGAEQSAVSQTGPAVTGPAVTGPAVTVPAGYTPPDDRVDSTGAYLPVNGNPTLVFVDAIW